MAAPAGFADLINRKYDIAQQEADARGGLEKAQAANITASTPFENALKAAQTYQTTETGKTVGPLAASSQAATAAGIGETQARTGLLGAQSALTGAQTADITADLAPIGRLGSGYFLKQLRDTGNVYAPGGAPAPAASGGPITAVNTRSVLDAPTAAAGAPPATAPTRTQISLGGGSGYYDENGNYVQGFAAGTEKVRSVPSPDTLGEENRQANFALDPGDQLARTIRLFNDDVTRINGGAHYAKGTARVTKPMKGAPPPGSPGAGAGGPPDLGAMLMAAMGADTVPGQGSGKVDKVRAMLAPGEAVVNKAGVKHIPGGRATIAKANAKGAAEMGLGKGKGAPPARAMPHFAAGTTDVSGGGPPAPGQTVTNGSWGPSAPPATPAPPPIFFPVPGAPAGGRTFGKRTGA